jgi:capsid protein
MAANITKAKKLKAPKFKDLAENDRKRIAAIIAGTVKRIGAFARGGYKTVSGPDQKNRKWSHAETVDETGILPINERNRLIALARNAARNSERLEGVIHQLEINVIGTDVAKAVFSFPPEFSAQEGIIREAFTTWAESAEYFDDSSLQEVARKILRAQLIGGDLVLVFDWDITSLNSGQIIAFEPDCIGNLEESQFKAVFPKFTQNQGVIKNEEGKTVGVIVSWSQRGQSTYRLLDSDGRRAAWPLVKPVKSAWEDCPFLFYREMSRFNQVRGYSRLWSGLGTIVDLADLQGYELQSAKKGAQTIGQVLQDEEKNEGELAAELDPDATAPVGSEDYAAAVKAARDSVEEEQEELDLEAISSVGAMYDVMPPGVRMELFNTTHPNEKLVEFSKWLQGGWAFAIGLANFHASGKADSSYSAAMAELLLSQVEFRDEFDKLKKRFLKWALKQWSLRAQMRGEIPSDDRLPPFWRRLYVKWTEPATRAINPVDEQNALNLGLKNGTILYRDKLGPEWKTKVKNFAEEVAFFKELGIPHIVNETVNGSIIEMNKPNEGNE